MQDKVKIGYSLAPVKFVDDSGKEVIRYKKIHAITTGNAVIVVENNKKVLLNKALSNKQDKITENNKLDASLISNISSFNQPDWNAPEGDKAAILNKPVLSTVATSGNYNDLENKPTIPTVSDTYNATSTNAMSGKAVASAIATTLSSLDSDNTLY